MNTFVFDLETTGLNPFHDDIIEIAIKKLNTDIIYHSYVKPTKTFNGKFVPEIVTNITKITHDMILKLGISQFMLCQYLFKFIKKHSNDNEYIYLIAHNGISFDMLFIYNLLKRFITNIDDNKKEYYINIYNKLRCIDTLVLSRLLLPEIKSYSQTNLCNIYNIQQLNPHSAVGDVNDLEKIYNNLIEKIINKKSENIYNLYNSL